MQLFNSVVSLWTGATKGKEEEHKDWSSALGVSMDPSGPAPTHGADGMVPFNSCVWADFPQESRDPSSSIYVCTGNHADCRCKFGEDPKRQDFQSCSWMGNMARKVAAEKGKEVGIQYKPPRFVEVDTDAAAEQEAMDRLELQQFLLDLQEFQSADPSYAAMVVDNEEIVAATAFIESAIEEEEEEVDTEEEGGEADEADTEEEEAGSELMDEETEEGENLEVEEGEEETAEIDEEADEEEEEADP
jgi:hypothetical protein